MTIKLFSIFISSLILVQSFNIHFGDILKLTELMEHVELHKKKYGDGFTVFFSKHYGDLKQSHKEEEKDHSHPPINHDFSSQLQASFVINIISFSLASTQIIKTYTNFHYLDMLSVFEKQKIFQPPQIA